MRLGERCNLRISLTAMGANGDYESPRMQMPEVGVLVNLPIPERHQVPTPIKLLGKHFIDKK